MHAHRKAGAFARAHKKHLIVGHAAAIVVAALVAFLLGAFAGPRLHTVFGQRLDAAGVRLYHRIAATKVEKGQRAGMETLPPAEAARIAALNAQVAAGTGHPHPLATPEPSIATSLVRNYSQRAYGAHPILLVVHDTESPNAPGTADIRAIAAWFNNPVSQASSNYTTDADGNTLLLVPDTAKAWTQAYFNSWAVSDELIGYASQKTWPDAQLREVAQLFAAEAKRWGIPIQEGAVSGCTIVRPGIVEHLNLGACGGGHHDAGPAFPLARFVALVKAYAVGGYYPAKKPVAKPVPKPTAPAVLRARTGYWSWLAWRLGQAAWKPYGKTNPHVRPHVPVRVPARWWRQAAIHVKGASK